MAEECKFYYYDNGYCCSLKKEKEGDSSVDSDDVKKYCWGYHYEDCPLYKNKDSSSGPCFLTSACVEAKGLPDDCYELQTLRSFRDGYMKNLPTGEEEIHEYYRIAPHVVQRIKEQPDALQVFETIYHELIVPCVSRIEKGENEQAHKLYRDAVRSLQMQYLA